MAGVRKDGILQVDDTGAIVAVPVEITEPIGSQPQDDSVSVTPSSDLLVGTQTVGPLTNAELDFSCLEGYNSFIIEVVESGLTGQLSFWTSFDNERVLYVFDPSTSSWINIVSYSSLLLNNKILFICPAYANNVFTIYIDNTGATGTVTVNVYASLSTCPQNNLTAAELANIEVQVATNFEQTNGQPIPTISALVAGKVQTSSPILVDGAIQPLIIEQGGKLRTNALTDTELRAAPVEVFGTVDVTEPVTVDGTISVTPTQEDLDAFSAGSTKIIPHAGVFNDGLSNLNSGELAVPRLTNRRGAHSNLRDSSGNEITARAFNSSGSGGVFDTDVGVAVRAQLLLQDSFGNTAKWLASTAVPQHSGTYPSAKTILPTSVTSTNFAALLAQIVVDINNRATECATVRLRGDTGSFVGTIQFLTTVNGNESTTPIFVYDINTNLWVQGSITNVYLAGTNHIFIVPIAGFDDLIVRCTAYTSGNIDVAVNTGPGIISGYMRAEPVKVPLLGTTAPAAAAVGVASALAVAANANRKGLILTNTSVNNISLGFGANAAVLNSGITLIPAICPRWEMSEYTYSQEAVNAIAAGAASNLAIQELI